MPRAARDAGCSARHAGAGRGTRLRHGAVHARSRRGPMWDAGGVDEVTWGATLTLTCSVASGPRLAFRRRGLAAGLRGGAITLLPAAALLTGTLELFTEIGGAVADWATRLGVQPGRVDRRRRWPASPWCCSSCPASCADRGVGARPEEPKPPRRSRRAQVARHGGQDIRRVRPSRTAPAIDDDMAEIEAILRKRGIT